jgi:hypothetical protein
LRHRSSGITIGSCRLRCADWADQKFELLKADPHHSSIRLKKVGQFWAARIGLHYRALAKGRTDGLVWFWIGTHEQYNHFQF